jgi:hypothetical protein
LLAIVAFAAAGAARDVVVLTDGRELEGDVVFEDEEVVVLREKSRDTRIEKAKVQEVRSKARDLREVLESALAVDPTNVGGNAQLATLCASKGLPRMASLFWWRVLAADADHAEANEALGHQQRGDKWVIPHRGKHYPLAKRREQAADWGEGWELRTTHYELRSNQPLEIAIESALDFERLYQAFFAVFGADLELYEVLLPMHAEVHSDSKSYPQRGGEAGYFAPSTNVLQVDASQSSWRSTMAHEATHQLLHNTAVLERTYGGSIPGWLNEAFAEYVEGSVHGEIGRLAIEPGRAVRIHFATHAEAKKPLTLARVLGLAPDDFEANTQSFLMYAQSYSLLYYCMHGEDGRRRDAFLEFVRAAYQGKASPTTFKKLLDVKEKRWEQAWHEFAASMAGA